MAGGFSFFSFAFFFFFGKWKNSLLPDFCFSHFRTKIHLPSSGRADNAGGKRSPLSTPAPVAGIDTFPTKWAQQDWHPLFPLQLKLPRASLLLKTSSQKALVTKKKKACCIRSYSILMPYSVLLAITKPNVHNLQKQPNLNPVLSAGSTVLFNSYCTSHVLCGR